MHFVGKILVVLQLILSIVFMAFAGVVYNAHISWRKEALTQKDNVAKVTKDLNDTRADLDRVKTETTQKVQVAEGKMLTAEAAYKGSEAKVAQLTKELADVQIAQKTSSQQALIAGEEASARNEESATLRKINKDQAAARDDEFAA